MITLTRRVGASARRRRIGRRRRGEGVLVLVVVPHEGTRGLLLGGTNFKVDPYFPFYFV